ncbi:TetR/AcrR family transcriptional regulator [Frondihabitans cladoniiphilus]|uniref:HTH tetR-type domain-containing protein n=1 Tax=Frondihabitans cladoniiphilus TaxID=715785 RepID=A0ABP8W3S9_9MICO
MSDDGTRGTAVLRASEACAALYIARGTTDLTVAEIAAAIGISQRTFYRYFPIKAETVSPLFAWTTATFDRAVADAPASESVPGILRSGFRAMLGGEVADRTRGLFPHVFGDQEMWSVFLRHVHDGERSLAPVLAARLELEAGSVEARAAAAAVASSTRIALEGMVTDGRDPEELFATTLEAFAAGPLRALPATRTVASPAPA